MNKKIKSIVSTLVFAAFMFSFSTVCYVKDGTEYSLSERRPLNKAPELSYATVASGEYMQNFESYTTDQFPYREGFRFIKSYFSRSVLRKLDTNGLFIAKGHISKLDDPKNDYMLSYAADKFKYIYDSFIDGKGANVYLSVIPDKNFVLTEGTPYNSMDYEDFIEDMKSKTPYMKYIDVTDLLSLNDFYKTDTHWRQENITDIAQRLASEMGTDIAADYTENTLENPFYGVYHGQLALPVKGDTIKYLTNDTIDNAIVTYYDGGTPKAGDMYNMEKAYSKDPYEMFLSGATPVVTIENPSAKTEKELVMFRDSYAGSLAPLMTEGYKKITLVDIRYMMSAFVGNFADFEGADVLFIYSTTLLNNSTAMK